jgi:anti-sigma regulatory factor (Ser/Thr protein kinase)
VAEPVRVDTVLATHEAVANAIEHSGAAGSITVRSSLNDRVCTIEVRDSGRWKDGPSDADRGKGLILIQGLVSRMEIEKRQVGTALRLIQHLS